MFGGTPPVKPLDCNCKIWRDILIDSVLRPRAHRTGDDAKPVLDKFMLPPEDIIKMPLYSCSQIVRRLLTVICCLVLHGKQKTLPTLGKQGEEILFRFVTCSHHVHPVCLRAFARLAPGIVQG